MKYFDMLKRYKGLKFKKKQNEPLKTSENKQKEKINIPLNFIKIDNKDIKSVYKKILDFKSDVDNDIINENCEKEIQLAERDVEKTINIKMYENEIKSRPKKKWFESKKDKKKRNYKK